MKKISLILCVSFISLFSTYLWAATAAESITVIDPYVRAVPPGQTVSAAFMQLKNSADKQHAIVNVKSSISKVVELHTHTHENGMMMMRQVEKIAIPANGETMLQPGGLHIMLIGLHNALELDQKISQLMISIVFRYQSLLIFH